MSESSAGTADLGAALFEALRVRYGHLLNEEQLEQVRHRLAEQTRQSQQLYSFPLTHADEPASSFRAALAEAENAH